MIKTIIRNLIRIVLDDKIDLVELIGAVHAFIWGIWLITHPGLFDNSTFYTILRTFVNEYFVGGVLMTLAFTKALGVGLDMYRFRKKVAFASIAVWMFLLFIFIYQNSNALIATIPGEVAALSIWEYFRHSYKAQDREKERQRQRELEAEIASHQKNVRP